MPTEQALTTDRLERVCAAHERNTPIVVFTNNGMFEIIGVYNDKGKLVLDTRRA